MLLRGNERNVSWEVNDDNRNSPKIRLLYIGTRLPGVQCGLLSNKYDILYLFEQKGRLKKKRMRDKSSMARVKCAGFDLSNPHYIESEIECGKGLRAIDIYMPCRARRINAYML